MLHHIAFSTDWATKIHLVLVQLFLDLLVSKRAGHLTHEA